MDDPKKKIDPGELPPTCSCGRDLFADLPPELRPKQLPNIGGLRQVICPGCGLKYWTNRATDVCMDCEKKGLRPLATDAGQGS
jgi:hypothetical protein